MSRQPLVLGVALSTALGVASASVPAQIADQLIVHAQEPNAALRFDRRLTMLGSTQVAPSLGTGLEQRTPIAIDGSGRLWIAYAALGPTELLRLTSDGALLPSAQLSHNPVTVTASIEGEVFAITRIPLLAPGPAYGVASDGTVLWSSWSGPSKYTLVYPQALAITTEGEIWMGGPTPLPGEFWARTLLLRLDPRDGAVMQSYIPPDLSGGMGDEVLPYLAAAPDGTLWMTRGGPLDGEAWTNLENTDGETLLQAFPLFSAGSNGATSALRVDGKGHLYVVSGNDTAGSNGKLLYRFDPAAPEQPASTYTMGGHITGHALGANGEEAYVMISPQSAPLTRRLERVNLVTGVKSSRPMVGWFSVYIAYGDPTGFIYANVVDRHGDNDGDGVPNGAETAARSNPFDALSTPDGPKAYVSFQPGTNVITLRWDDPDGLFDPAGGLDLSTISLEADGYGEVMVHLWPFLTQVTLAPDGTSATVVLGGLPLPEGLKIGLEARVRDKTGHEGWDWQVTPPGDL